MLDPGLGAVSSWVINVCPGSSLGRQGHGCGHGHPARGQLALASLFLCGGVNGCLGEGRGEGAGGGEKPLALCHLGSDVTIKRLSPGPSAYRWSH